MTIGSRAGDRKQARRRRRAHLVRIVVIISCYCFRAALAFSVNTTPLCQGRVCRCCLPLLWSHSHESTKSDISEKDEFAHLVENHPLDDPEPSLGERGPNKPSAPLSTPYSLPSSPKDEWELFYSLLKKRSTERNSSDISNSNILEEALLRHWMAQQRKAFMKTLGVLDLNEKDNWGTPYLSRHRKQLLDKAKFPWGHLQPSTLTNDIVYRDDFQRRVRLHYKDWIWDEWFQQLSNYVRDYGQSNVSVMNENYRELALWTMEQRNLRWEMQERRRMRLDELRFDWDWTEDEIQASLDLMQEQEDRSANKSIKVSFGTRLKQLKEYRKTRGDCKVPLSRPDGLGEWVRRIQGRRSDLSPNTVRALEKIGLVFFND